MNNHMVVIDDDNSNETVDEIEIIEIQDKNTKCHNILKRVREMDIIVIDDEPKKDRNTITEIDNSHANEGLKLINGAINNNKRPTRAGNSIIEIDDSEEYEGRKKNTIYYYDIIFKENKLLSEFIERCLDIENSGGMLKVINRTLLNIYKHTDESYKKSVAFNKVLLKSLNNLDKRPELKFSHIKELCEILKCHKVKKKVSFITLETNLWGNKTQNKPVKSRKNNLKWHYTDEVMKKQNIDVINLDDLKQKEVIDLDNDVILLDDIMISGENSIKENDSINNNNENNNCVSLDNRIDKTSDGLSNATKSRLDAETLETEKVENTNENSDQLLVPISNQDEYDPSTNVIIKKIKEIENCIANYKTRIKQLDLEVVNDDTISSPYIKSEKLKAKIVALYKDLCDLTGSEVTKQRKVRLQVAEGHTVGPMRCLEEFINSNIGDDGEPVFPDFRDVNRCVQKANVKYNLGWNAGQVNIEAKALFTQYGTAMQKWRQHREWRDLMSHIKEETDMDPAENDQELLARLEENKQIAMKNEKDLLQRFANLESNHGKDSNPMLSVMRDDSDDYSENEEKTSHDELQETTFNHSPNKKVCDFITNNIAVFSHSTQASMNYLRKNHNTQIPMANDTIVTNKESEMGTILGSHSVTVVNSNIDRSVHFESYKSHDKLSKIPLQEPKAQKHTESPTSVVVKTEQNVEQVNKNNILLIENDNQDATALEVIKKVQTDPENNTNNGLNMVIKREPEDIPAMLANLGSDFTATIIDIEDPFLVIDISSDSNSEDDVNT